MSTPVTVRARRWASTPGARLARLVVGALLGGALVGAALASATGCDQSRPPQPQVLGVSAAKQHLYPYEFTTTHSFRGTRILESYLAEHPEGQDRPMARWLLARTWTDALTRALTLRASGAGDAGDVILSTLAAEVGATQATPEAVAAAAATRVRELVVDGDASPLQIELVAVLEFLDAIGDGLLKADPIAPASAFETLARLAESERTVASNARLLLAARTIEIAEAPQHLDLADVPAAFAAVYPFACPAGMLAYATGDDRSLAACNFVCPGAAAELERTKADYPGRTLLVTACGTDHFGFSDPRDAAMLTRPNVVLALGLRHMSDNLEALDRSADETLLGPLHEGMLDRAERALAQLTLPLALPVLGPEDEIHLPTTTGLAAPSPGISRSVAITEDGVRVNVAAHIRVDKGDTFVPEVLLRYRHPGRLAVAPTEPFTLGRIDRDRAGRLVKLRDYLTELETDRDRIYAQLGSRVVGPTPRSAVEAMADPRVWLLADLRSAGEPYSATVATLYDAGYRGIEVITFDTERLAAGAVPYQLVMRGADPSPDAAILEIGLDTVRFGLPGAKIKPIAGADLDARLGAVAGQLDAATPLRLRVEGALGPALLAQVGAAFHTPTDAPAADPDDDTPRATPAHGRVLQLELVAAHTTPALRRR